MNKAVRHRLALGEEIQLGPRRGKRMSGTIGYKKHLIV